MAKATALVFLLLLMFQSATLAQKPFETLEFSIGSDLIISGNSILDHWDPSKRVAASLRTPYFRGELEAGGRYFRFDENSFEDSGFRSIYLFLGWHYPLSVSDRLSIIPGFRIGTNFLTQDNKREYFGGGAGDPFIFHEEESIFAYELMLRSGWSLTERTTLTASISYNRSALQIPFSLSYLSVGVSRTFTMPGWLQTVVK